MFYDVGLLLDITSDSVESFEDIGLFVDMASDSS